MMILQWYADRDNRVLMLRLVCKRWDELIRTRVVIPRLELHTKEALTLFRRVGILYLPIELVNFFAENYGNSPLFVKCRCAVLPLAHMDITDELATRLARLRDVRLLHCEHGHFDLDPRRTPLLKLATRCYEHEDDRDPQNVMAEVEYAAEMALRCGNVEGFLYFCKEHNAFDSRGVFVPPLLLVHAARAESLEAVQYVWGRRWATDANVTDGRGRTALWIAARYGHLDIVRFLLDEAGADQMIAPNNGIMEILPLELAISFGHVEVVRLLLERAPELVNRQRPHDQATPFTVACHTGHADMVRMLLSEFGADPTLRAVHGRTCLYVAVHAAHLDVVRVLLDDPRTPINAVDDYGAHALIGAAIRKQEDIVRLLEDRGARLALDPTRRWIELVDSTLFEPALVFTCPENVEVVRLACDNK